LLKAYLYGKSKKRKSKKESISRRSQRTHADREEGFLTNKWKKKEKKGNILFMKGKKGKKCRRPIGRCQLNKNQKKSR